MYLTTLTPLCQHLFFAACPFFLPAASSALFCFCEAALFQEPEALSRTLDYSIKPPPLCQLLFLLFSPLLYTPPRVSNESTPNRERAQLYQPRSFSKVRGKKGKNEENMIGRTLRRGDCKRTVLIGISLSPNGAETKR